VPVVVGVGHERDESLCDFVADFRASTPSNAAECLWPNGHDLRRYLVQSEDRLQDRFNAQVRNYQLMVERSVMLFERTMIEVGNRLRSGVINLSYAFDRFRLSLLATREHIERQQQIQLRNFAQGRQALRDKLLALSRVLDSVNPKKVLARGYAIARLGKRIITDPTTLATGDRFSLQFLKGELQVEVSGLDKQKKLF
jgi:exodeoxyribonuclease VII large subunit